MKVCYIFRGENERKKRGYVNSCNNANNWNKTLFDPLKEKNIEFDIFFLTYDSPILTDVINVYKPKEVRIEPCISQASNFKNIANFLEEKKDQYDRFVILRFDFMYRKKITEWPKWNQEGIFILNKDVTWPSKKYYTDILFIVDKNHINSFNLAARSFNGYPHELGQFLYFNNIDFHLIYDTYHHMHINNPIVSLATYEPEPDLDNPTTPLIIDDVSQWN